MIYQSPDRTRDHQDGPRARSARQPGVHRANRTSRIRPSRGGSLFAGAIAVAVVSAAAGSTIALTIHPYDSAVQVNAGLVDSAIAQRAATLPATSVDQVAAEVLPSVVTLLTTDGNQAEQGSGIVLTADGLILTNRHVVQIPGAGADQVPSTLVTLSDGRTASLRVVSTDPLTDIAVVRAQGISGLTPITFGSSADLRVGQQVVAVGSPLGLQGTVTDGIISALHRPVSASAGTDGQGTVLEAIQTDAAMNPGNSGGALVDMNGKLIGVNSAIASIGGQSPDAQSGSIGVGFAIPADQAKRIVDELIATGKASHASLGVQLSSDAGTRGAVVTEVTTDGPAATAGLSNGALITKVDNSVIGGPEALLAVVGSKAPGDYVTLTYVDGSGTTQITQVTLGTDQDQQ